MYSWDKPILLVWGLSDKYLPLSEAEAFQKGNPNAVKIKQIEGAGHMPQEDWYFLFHQKKKKIHFFPVFKKFP